MSPDPSISDPSTTDPSTSRARRGERRRAGVVRRASGVVSRVPGALRDRGAEVADLRRVFPDLPRAPRRRDLEGRAERLLRRAAANEAAREGADMVDRLVDLPSGWGRADLTAAEIPSLPSYESFVVAAASAPQIRPVSHGAADALAMARSEAANDELGITLEGAGDAASFLLTRTWELLGPEGTDAEDLESYLEGWRERARGIVRDALTRAVTVPQELRVAVRRRDELRDAEAARGTGGEGAAQTAPDAADESPVRTPRRHRVDEEAFGTASAQREARHGTGHGADHGEDANPADPTERASSGRAPRSFAQRARDVQDFLQSDTGRSAREFLASDAGRAAMQFVRDHGKDAGLAARDLYVAAREQRSGGKRSGS